MNNNDMELLIAERRREHLRAAEHHRLGRLATGLPTGLRRSRRLITRVRAA